MACSPQAWAAATPFLLLQSVLGISSDAPSRTLFVRDPAVPPAVREVVVEGLRVGRARVSLLLSRKNARCHVDVLDVAGGDVRTVIELG